MDGSLKTSRQLPSIATWFDRMADAAIRRHLLCVGEVQFAIVETEFYFHAEGHEDPSVHRSEKQLTCGEWYFHREKAAKIGFTLKGLDLTFGDRGRGEYGGMLIRALARPDGTRIIEGPSRVVDAILTTAGVDSVAGLKALRGYADDALAPASYLRLTARDTPWGEDIRAGRRVGLKEAAPYAGAAYRYRALPALAAKGRAEISRGRLVGCGAALPRLSDDDIDTLLADLAAPGEPLAEGGRPQESWGIVGYRHFADYPRFVSELKGVAERAGGMPARVVSGGAPGTDSMAARWARENGIPLLEHLPRAPRAADLLARNTLIVRDSTVVVAFLSRESRGTRDTIAKARGAGVPVVVVHVD